MLEPSAQAYTFMQAAEYYSGHLVALWHEDHGRIDRRSGQQRQQKVLRRAFLPEGYPDSVTADYANFQLWDSIQAICSYIRGILTSQAMLTGIGVGQQAATPLSAVFQFFLRDLSGMLGGIIFAFFQGAKLDIYAKQWRLFADCLNNVGLALELASPAFPSLFLIMACLGSIARAITGVAGGSTRAALTLHFALKNNAADISAKEGTQETATTLVGMLLGMGLTHSLQGLPVLIWITFLSLTALHIYANVRAMRSLVLTSLNPSRLLLLLDAYFDKGQILSPAEVSLTEPLAAPPVQKLMQWGTPRPPHIVMGASLSHLVTASKRTVQQLSREALDRLYIVTACQGQVHVILAQKTTTSTVITAYMHACILSKLLHHRSTGEASSKVPSAESQSLQWMESHAATFQKALTAAGWAVDKASLAQSDCTAAWGVHVHLHDE